MTTTLSSSNSGDSVVGSFANVSIAAPPSRPSRIASASASSSTMPPRPALIEPHAGLGVREHLGVHEADRVGRLGRVDRHEVGDRDELVHRLGELHAELAGPVGAHERVVGDEPHPERVRTLRDEHTDAAEADDAERLAVQLDTFPLRAVPLARPCRSALACGTLRACASSSAIVCSAAERMFDCGAFTTITPRRVASRDVDVVEPDPGPADHDEIGAGREHLGGHLRRAADHQRGDAGQRRAELLGRETGLDLDVEAGGAHRVEPAFGEWFGDENT